MGSRRERRQWLDLQAVTLDLQQVTPDAVAAAVRHGAATLFGADVTAVLRSDDPAAAVAHPAILAAARVMTEPIVVRVRDADPDLRTELTSMGVVTGVLAPLRGLALPTGALLLGYRGGHRLTRSDLQVIGTLANHAAVTMQRARLFGELEEQRSRLSAVIDNASDGVVLVGADGTVQSWNPGMTRLTQRPEGGVLGHPLDEALGGRGVDGNPFAIRPVLDRLDRLASNDHLTVDLELIAADGSLREASVSVSAVRAPSGACEYAVLVARDTTGRREVAQAKQDFIATVSHELRTPLTPIKGFLSLFLRPGFQMDEDDKRRILAQMLDRANQLERLVDDLLSTSRMEHGEFSLRLEPTDVGPVIERAMDDLRLITGRSVTRTNTGLPLAAVTDPARLQQVLANLLSNADKYSPAGTAVVLHVHYHAEVIEISVRDFGVGIAENQQAEVFEPFRRLGDHLTRQTRGCGLGLHIARRLVQSMGGEIWVDSRLGEGSTFHLTVPAVREAVPALPVGR